MDDFLRNARKQLKDLDLEAQLKDFDFGKLKGLDFERQKQEIRRQLEELAPQKREQKAEGEGFLGGLLLGIIVGAVVALIFAPKSGSETREMVAGTAADLKHKAEDLVGQGHDDAGNGSSATAMDEEPAIEREIGNSPGAI